MIPYEIGLLVLLFALLSTINGVFRETRWLSFVCLSFAVFGVTGLADIGSPYLTFFYFGPVCVVAFLIATLYSGAVQRVVLAAAGTVVLFGAVFLEAKLPDYYLKALAHLALFGLAMALPALVSRVDEENQIRVEKILAAEQAWARVMFLVWCRENATNIQHYEFFTEGLPALSLVACAILLTRVALTRQTWYLASRSFISAAVMAGGLSFQLAEIRFLLLWTLFLGLVDIAPELRGGRTAGILRRFNLGAFGGLAFWGLLFFLEKAPMNFTWKMIWGAMIFTLGLAVMLLPGRQEDREEKSQWIPSFGFVLQGLFLAIVVFWPSVKEWGGL